MRFPALGRPTRFFCIASITGAVASVTLGAGALHLRLESSDPPDGGVVTELPAELRLVFSAAIERGLAEVQLTAADRGPISVAVRRDSADDRVLLGAWPDLAAGAWEVAWKVVSLDGHTVRNTFEFTYDPPRPEPGADAQDDTAGVESGVEAVPAGDAANEGDAADDAAGSSNSGSFRGSTCCWAERLAGFFSRSLGSPGSIIADASNEKADRDGLRGRWPPVPFSSRRHTSVTGSSLPAVLLRER